MNSLFKMLQLNKDERRRYRGIAKDLQNPPQWFTKATRLTNGQSFGELALLNDSPRAATIQCINECIFAVIERKDYKRVLKQVEQRA